jgi:hypothetical protein
MVFVETKKFCDFIATHLCSGAFSKNGYTRICIAGVKENKFKLIYFVIPRLQYFMLNPFKAFLWHQGKTSKLEIRQNDDREKTSTDKTSTDKTSIPVDVLSLSTFCLSTFKENFKFRRFVVRCFVCRRFVCRRFEVVPYLCLLKNARL